jgi:glutamate---cysteine ligase / carboxylate-amine ligase
MPSALTLGVEEELHLVDLESGQLAARAPQLLSRLPAESYSAELQRTTVETNTAVCTSLDELRREIVRLRKGLVDVAAGEGLGVAAVGTPPLSSGDDFELTPTGRFGRMHDEYRLLVDEQLICGTQVHVGVADRDLAVAIAQRVSLHLPLLLALSASSPFWHGTDTGYASIRTIIWQRWPTAGTTGPIASAAEYDDLVSDLIATGVIADAKMAYFDVRPSSHVPTVELRVCDACPLADDAVLIAGLFRALVASAEEALLRGERQTVSAPPLHRAAMWRAARSGLAGGLLDDSPRPQPIPASDAVHALLSRLRPQLENLGDWSTISELTEATLRRGNSADRQRAVFAEHGLVKDVVEAVVTETHGPAAGAPLAPTGLRRYPARAGDEAFMASGEPRPVYRPMLEAIEELGLAGLGERLQERDRWAEHAGMTFGVDGEQRPFPADLVPRTIPAHEWAFLSIGLEQRARALELFLQDVYGQANIVRDGILPADVVTGAPGWRSEARLLPVGKMRAPIMGFDLVRNELGGWRVLEDNVRVPSGAGYAIALRQVLDDVMPMLPRPEGLLDPRTGATHLHQTLAICAGVADARIALLSDGAGNAAWFEHRLLAEQAGFLLVQPGDVQVENGAVTAMGRHIDLLYLRLDVELIDLTDNSARPIGAAILNAAADGGVTLANAPGNGVADDKATYCRVPDLIAYYLGEKPLLDAVPTYRCGDPSELQPVLERVGELVTKPVDGYGGGGVMIGPLASAAEVAARRAEIAGDPGSWVAQELVPLSSHPTFNGAELEPRYVDLRAFVYLHGTAPEQARTADLALTRVAPKGSMVVNSSRGGGAKDTWIISDNA